MKNPRVLNIPLALLIALSLSGLQVLAAPCVAMTAPMACDVEMASGGCGDGELRAGCCCLVDEGETAAVPVVVVAEFESGFASTLLSRQRAIADLPVRRVVSLSHQAHAPKQYPQLFQLYCSFLI